MTDVNLPLERIKGLRLMVFDFDGVFTDNRVLVMDDGHEAVWCSRGDGLGVSMIKAIELPLLVMSMETNAVVSQRCQKLGIECLQGIGDKWPALAKLLQDRGVSADQVSYMGNDLNDIECMRHVGLPVAVADAYPEVLEAALIVTRHRGGHGAVRELCDMVRCVKSGNHQGKTA